MTIADNTSDVLWACVEKGFHVGSRRGEFLGYVDLQSDGRYRAFDARGGVVGDFSALDDATSAVVDAGRGTDSAPAEVGLVP
ncbi:hypothetical protein [uncultured Microbacterium sp.]|uniref:hypothetical protein n=1 Tax=uncultured Microbacterium sp. TaxID=191216 RepID=UPI0025ECC3F8|nr:hypothetical protein [uncultured Microbacterium sp.]